MDTTGGYLTKLNEHHCIAIMGKAGAGKDTLADMITLLLREQPSPILKPLGKGTLRPIRFSAPLKALAADLFNWDKLLLENLEYKEEILPTSEWVQDVFRGKKLNTRRAVLQHLGTDIFREMDANIWVKYALRKAEKDSALCDGFISTDCRFPNEQQGLKDAFKSVLFVKLHKGEALPVTSPMHASEDIDRLTCDMEFHVKAGDMARLRCIAALLTAAFLSNFEASPNVV